MSERDLCRGCNPQTDDSAIECNGEYTMSNCVITGAHPYLNIMDGDSLNKYLQNAIMKMKNLTNSLGAVYDKPTYIDDQDAEANGLEIGDIYWTTTGYLKKRVS